MTKTVIPRQKTDVARFPFQNLFPRSMFEDWFQDYFTDQDTGMQQIMRASMDVAETDQAFEVTMDLPGVHTDDVEIHLDNNTLTVRGERKEEREEGGEDKQFHRIERYSGTFSRSVVLPNTVNDGEAAAEFRDGVLKITVPKTEDSKPRKIKIKK